MEVLLIHATEIVERRRQGQRVELIDVRTPAEYQEVHVELARNMPLSQFDPQVVLRERPDAASEPLYVICRSGQRSQQACIKLLQAGFTNVFNVQGGTLACIEAGLPVIRGRKTMSLERQVRIAAGALVVLGAILAWLIHPAFIGLSALVGAGMIFAGMTNQCGMGMLLARMPWNQGNQTTPGSCSTH